MKYRVQNPEVFYTEEIVTSVDRPAIEGLKRLAVQNPGRRVRICAHDTTENALHEMLIVMERGVYIRPHKHPGKSESAHIVEGVVDVVVFGEEGGIADVVRMGDYASGKTFYYRMAKPLFHSLIVRSDFLVFHETTNGPFDGKNTIFAPWAPDGGDANAVDDYIAGIENGIQHLIR